MREYKAAQLVPAKPPQHAVLLRRTILDGSLPFGDEPDGEYDRDRFVLDLSPPLTRRDHFDAEFFLQLAPKRTGEAFVSLDMAPNHVPDAGELSSRLRPMAEQHAAVVEEKSADHAV